MQDTNSIILVGRLTKSIELERTQGGKAYTKFSIAVNEFKENEVSFFDIVVWDKMAEICQKYLEKGSQIIVNGRLKQDRFKDKSGNNVSRVSIIANNIQFIGSKKDSGEKKAEQKNIDFGNGESKAYSDFGNADNPPSDIPF